VKVKGKEKMVSVFEVYDGDPPALRAQKDATREVFQKGVFEYHAGRFAEARALFDSVGAQELPDRPFEIYRERCDRSLKLGTVEGAGTDAERL
jgi:adenylate cyclase